MTRNILLVMLLVALGGCTSLQAVRDYSVQSAKASAYKDVTNHWIDTYKRQAAYVVEPELSKLKAVDDGRQKQRKSLLAIHDELTAYFSTLSQLAGADSLSLSKNIEGLEKSIDESKLVKKQYVTAYSSLLKVLSNQATGIYQQKKVRDFIEEGNPHIQVILSGVNQVILPAYYSDLNEEPGFSTFLLYVDEGSPNEKIIRAISQAEYTRINAEISDAKRTLVEAQGAFQRIQNGHQKLFDSRGKFSKKELKKQISDIAKDIREINKSLQKIGE